MSGGGSGAFWRLLRAEAILVETTLEQGRKVSSTMRRRLLAVLLVLALSAAAAAIATAQVTTATIYGSITDQAGAPIVGATVTATMEATATSVATTSNELGEFTFTFLPVGRYRLTISAQGFKEQSQPGIELVAGQRQRLTYTLEIGSVSEKVIVTAEAPIIQAVSPEQQETHSTLEVKELPLSRRDWTNILIVGTGTNVRGTGVVLNGIGAGAFNFTVDGTEASSSSEDSSLTLFGNFNFIKAVSLEAIAEVNVNKGIMSAEFADTISGNIGLITKSGTNEYHGSLFWNYQGRVLNARNAFLTTRPPEVFNQFGASAGGPIIKNKLFFFGVYEGYRQRRFTTFNSNVATEQFRAQAIAAVPQYKLFFDTQPLPNRPHDPTAVTGQFAGFGSNAANDNHVVGRVDYYLSDRNMLHVRYTRGRPDSFQPRASTLNPRTFDGVSEVVTSGFTHSRSNFSAQTRFGVNYSSTERADRLFDAGIPLISGPGFSDGAEILNSKGTGWSIEEVLAFTRGRHSIKMGGIFQYQGQTRENIGSPNFSYSTTSDFLANTPSSVSFTFGIKEYLITYWLNGYFIQDDFKIRPNLVLNLGLRYDYYSVPRERDGRLFNREAPFGLGPLRSPDSVYEADRNNFAPRIGFAWTVDSDGKTVVRGGSGIFYMRHPVRNTLQLVRNAVDEPFRVSYSRAEAIALNLRYPLNNDDVLALAKSPNAPWTDSTINPNFPDAYSIQWTLSVQRQLTSSLALETAYVGNHALKLIFTKYINRVDRQTGLRPFAGFGEFRHFDTSESIHYHGWQSSLRKRFSDNFLFNLHYTWSSNISYLAGDISTDQDAPQDLDDIRSNRGPTPFDIRHRFASDFLYELPFARIWDASSAGRRLLLSGWQLGGIFVAESGAPFHADMPNAFRNQRIDYIGGPAYLDDPNNPLQYLNPAAFARVPIVQASGATERPGTLGRGALRLPGFWNIDLSLSKSLRFTETIGLQIRADMFNAFNHTNLSGINTNITNANFGRFTSARDARVVQLNMRLTF